jgi:hypothetical protein
MSAYAIVQDNTVTAILTLEESQVHELCKIFNAVICVDNMSPQPKLGWLFDGNRLYSSTSTRRITKLAMLQRFTVPERLAILNYMSANPSSIPSMLIQNIQVATFVDLDRSDTAGGVYALVSLGLITLDRATQILTSAITAIEEYHE